MSLMQAKVSKKQPLSSDGIQNFKNRLSFASNSLTTFSLILESPFAAVVQGL